MSNVALRAEGLGKSYRLSHRERLPYRMLRDDLRAATRLPLRWLRGSRTTKETFWALKDVTFEVKRGEVVGIIGRNGAGKSTLLKLLSRITEPTTGFAEMHGRVGSLLEVGTGFHPELTGRENVFLNGAILGMKQSEIRKKFDEIVAFSEVEKFLDTPVKRYSSGMYVRLAFAVAAHFEPEILIVDEVLAVGDAQFQKKCLGKMENVAKEGRTVLFVSHNVGVIQQLCPRVLLFESGGILLDGPSAAVIARYNAQESDEAGEKVFDPKKPPMLADTVALQSIRVLDQAGKTKPRFDVKEPVAVEVAYEVRTASYVLNTHLYFRNDAGETVFVAMNNLDSPWQGAPQPAGVYRERCTIPADYLNEGVLRVEFLLCTNPTSQHYVSVPDAIAFQMTDDMAPEGVRGNWSRPWPKAMTRPRFKWSVERHG